MNTTFLSLSRAKLKNILKLKQKKYRYINKIYLCEGWRLFTAASESTPELIKEIIISDSFVTGNNYKNFSDIIRNKNIPIYQCSDKIFKQFSDEKNPYGILFIMHMNYYSYSNLDEIKDANCIYLENISDPGNLGTIIRTAVWFGFPTILFSDNSVDPFNEKVIRATAGGIFSAKLYLNISIDYLLNFGLNKKYRFIGTTVNDGEPLSDWKVSDKNIIFFGSEANGLTKPALQILNQRITIKGSNTIESLNLSVTTGIVMNHLFNRLK